MIDKDAEIRRLNIRVRELQDEVDEWRRQGRQRAQDAEEDADVGRAMRTFSVSRQRAMLLLHMLRRPGAAQSHEALRDVIVLGEATDGIKMVAVAVCKLRKPLARLGASIETVWGIGYRIDAASVEIVREHLGLVA